MLLMLGDTVPEATTVGWYDPSTEEAIELVCERVGTSIAWAFVVRDDPAPTRAGSIAARATGAKEASPWRFAWPQPTATVARSTVAVMLGFELPAAISGKSVEMETVGRADRAVRGVSAAVSETRGSHCPWATTGTPSAVLIDGVRTPEATLESPVAASSEAWAVQDDCGGIDASTATVGRITAEVAATISAVACVVGIRLATVEGVSAEVPKTIG